MRHDKVRDFLAKKAQMVHNDTETEPRLKPVNGELLSTGTNLTNGARSDIRIRGLMRQYQNSFVDVKVTNVMA